MAGDGGGAELGLAFEGLHVRVPAVDDLLRGHAAAAGAGGLLGLVESEEVGAAGGDGGLGVGRPAGVRGVLVVVEHGHELDARYEGASGLAPVVAPADVGGAEEAGEVGVSVGETAGFDVAGGGRGCWGGGGGRAA